MKRFGLARILLLGVVVVVVPLFVVSIFKLVDRDLDTSSEEKPVQRGAPKAPGAH